jgi:hypothetical protein
MKKLLLMVFVCVVIFFVLMSIRPTPAAAQLPPGPNLRHGVPFTYVPWAGIFPARPFVAPLAYGPYDAGLPPPLAPLPPPLEPPPVGWVYGPYLNCAPPADVPLCFVTVDASGLNVRTTPNGQPVMALTNGTPVILQGQERDWFLVGVGCNLVPTWAWSVNAGVTLMRCWL